MSAIRVTEGAVVEPASVGDGVDPLSVGIGGSDKLGTGGGLGMLSSSRRPTKSQRQGPHSLGYSIPATWRHASASLLPSDSSHSIWSRQVDSPLGSVEVSSTSELQALQPQYVLLTGS